MLSDRKLRQKVVVFLLSGIVVVSMPVAAILGIFSGKFEFTDDQITQIADSIEGDSLAKLIKVDSTLGELQQTMISANIQDRFI